MNLFQDIKRSFLISLWFVFLTFPLMVIKVNPFEETVIYRWHNALYVALGAFVISFFLKFIKDLKEKKDEEVAQKGIAPLKIESVSLIHAIIADPVRRNIFCAVILGIAIIFPFIFSAYQVNIMTTALMYVVLGLGLNIVVGMAGLLDLGFVAFYAVGAYSYALLNTHFGLGFWTALPIGGALAALFGLILGFPVLRLRGDYLAIVTLGFGEIIRLILENWNSFSNGPAGISDIARPSFFGMDMSLDMAINYVYYIAIVFVIITIFIVNRLQDSRLGRAWMALREDEIACQSMGIDKRRTKLVAFFLGAFWAGLVGVMFAAKTTFINPASFTFLESAIILAIVVLGGMGSIVGVILGALVLILMPEYLRALSEYRMLAFGGVMVVMMVFRPQGLISTLRRKYKIERSGEQETKENG